MGQMLQASLDLTPFDDFVLERAGALVHTPIQRLVGVCQHLGLHPKNAMDVALHQVLGQIEQAQYAQDGEGDG